MATLPPLMFATAEGTSSCQDSVRSDEANRSVHCHKLGDGMKVLIVTFEFVPFAGGIAAYTHEIAKGLTRLDCDVMVLAPRYPDCNGVDAASAFHTVRMSATDGTLEVTRFLPGMRYLHRALRVFRPDVALLTSDLAHGIGGLMCARRKVPFVAVVHGSEIAKHFPPKTLKRYGQSLVLKSSYRSANAIICVSQFVKTMMVNAGFDGRKLHVIRNGIDEAFVNTAVSADGVASLRSRYRLGHRKVILSIARLARGKGQAQMIRAMPAILARHSDVCYLIVGTGDNESRLKALARDIGVGHAVLFAGQVPADEKLDHLDLCDAYGLLSRGDSERVEGLGIALLEAAARAKPLIGARHGGIGEIIEEGVNGYQVDPMNTEEVAERVTTVLGDPTLACDMGNAAKRTIVDGFLATKMTQATKFQLERVSAPDER